MWDYGHPVVLKMGCWRARINERRQFASPARLEARVVAQRVPRKRLAQASGGQQRLDSPAWPCQAYRRTNFCTRLPVFTSVT
jgi:hypothetical protein